ncbi:hypothetical protein GUITHDRAFT_77334, partial [Guillardia theta CCMP2712]
QVLDRILLRRTKLGRAEDIVLPPKVIILRKDFFDPFESDFYQSLYTQSQTQFNAYVQQGTILNNYAHIFDLLIRLRQAVNHPYLVQYSEKNYLASQAAAAAGAAAGADSQDSEQCGLCKDEAEDKVVSACKHCFCRSCIEEYVASAPCSPVTCPTCEQVLSVDLSPKEAPPTPTAPPPAPSRSGKAPRIMQRFSRLDDFKSSTKIEALMEELELLVENDSSAKAIVFSQFVSMLDLIAYRLELLPPPHSSQLAGIRVVKLDGRMTFDARDRHIASFCEDADTRVFLISLKAGGVALNLTVASAVYIMDPWWNPAVEFQAMDRIHRLGQYKPIKVVRFVIEDTIEDRILRLQEKKRLVFESTVGRSSEALAKLTEADMKFLFS